MFYERQEGGLCRKHSINAFFQEARISTQEFIDLNQKYSRYLEEKYGNKVEIIDNDVVYSNDIGIIPYILYHQENQYCFHFAINQIQETFQHYHIFNAREWLEDNDFIFIYNPDHIWGMKKENNNWHKIDSLSGIAPNQNINNLIHEKNIGIIVPRKKHQQKQDRESILLGINKIISKYTPSTVENESNKLEIIHNVIQKMIDEGRNTDWLEPLVGLYMNILDTINDKSQQENDLIQKYNDFIRHYERNKTDYEYLKINFGYIVNSIINLQL